MSPSCRSRPTPRSPISWRCSTRRAFRPSSSSPPRLRPDRRGARRPPLVSDVWQIGLGDLDKLAGLGRSVADSTLDDLAAQVTADTAAAILKSTASDGATELVTVSHRALTARALAIAAVLDEETGAGASTLQILPATDVHARVSTLVAVATGTRLGHLSDPARLIETMASFRPTLLVASPAALALIDEAAHDRAESTGRASALRQGLEVAVDHSIAVGSGTVPRGLKTRFALADALVYRGLRKAVGGQLRTVVSIADETSLAPRLRHIMRSLDVRALEGYGTLLTTGLATLERPSDPFDRPVGGVGAPLDGVSVAVGSDGSIALRGVGVKAAGDDGWLATGQFGTLDDGRLVLADRDLVLTPVVDSEVTLSQPPLPESAPSIDPVDVDPHERLDRR
ncbi:hypothetical protein GCM10025867_26600 [Frondihabitans sucicola]|uniref:AMP-dependent synthetase/ligase domain-containing protein n=1 Tax=Frondihabitans sucicola TaxID=1268041 RepID=A0ABN6XZG6_9MICO|nr:AMP-binding protein [Frondihabitans sucicola]BDZ50419.1 hypothetical protein GCM10025867_26600 [Frondihabitans sucicola]